MPELEVTPEHAADPNTRRVGILVGVVGILLSVVTIASHRAHTDAVIHRTEANDQWSYYQAKKIRENTEEVALVAHDELGHRSCQDRVRRRQSSRPRAPSTPRTQKRFKMMRVPRTRKPRKKNIARCFSTSAKACWSSDWCCARCISWRAKCSFRSSACSQALPARSWASWVSCFEKLSGLDGALSHAATRCLCRRRPRRFPRVEARSNDLLAVGVVRDDKMIIHISRLADNAPVRDAVVTVVLRGTAHADDRGSRRQLFAADQGSGAARRRGRGLSSRPGSRARDSLKGTLDIGSQPGPVDDKNSSRQLWWWVLNFAVCGAACVAVLAATQGREGPDLGA